MSEIKGSKKRKNQSWGYQCMLIGRNKEKECEQYLIEHCIPYRRNNIIYADCDREKKNKHGYVRGNTLCEFDFIIPGAIIEVKAATENTINCGKFFKTLKIQISNFKKYIPTDFNIYVYIHNVTEEQCKKYSDLLGIIIITDFNEIKCESIPYFITDPCALRSLITDNEERNNKMINKYKTIITLQKSYTKAYITFTDNEKKIFEKYNIKIKENIDDISSYCIFKKSSDTQLIKSCDYLAPDYKIFKIFCEKYQVIERKSKCIPLVKIPEISDECLTCNQLFFINRLDVNKVCCICRAIKRQKVENTTY